MWQYLTPQAQMRLAPLSLIGKEYAEARGGN